MAGTGEVNVVLVEGQGPGLRRDTGQEEGMEGVEEGGSLTERLAGIRTRNDLAQLINESSNSLLIKQECMEEEERRLQEEEEALEGDLHEIVEIRYNSEGEESPDESLLDQEDDLTEDGQQSSAGEDDLEDVARGGDQPMTAPPPQTGLM